jgi:energy-converting hydrogenase A subunit D
MQEVKHMNEFYLIILSLIAILGVISVYIKKSPFDKLIGLAIMLGGVIPFIILKGYLDVAILVAVIMPLTTIFILQATGRHTDDS